MIFSFSQNRPRSKKKLPGAYVIFSEFLIVIMITFSLSACMSSTLNLNNDPFYAESTSSVIIPVPVARSEADREQFQSQALRSRAIAEIHTRAKLAFTNEAAPLYASPDKMKTRLLSSEEVFKKMEEMNAVFIQSEGLIQDAELKLKRHKMNRLLQKGKIHYNSALKRIEKK